MKLKTALITASTLAILSGCADLGFGDFPLADATDETAGPVMVADLETTNVATAPPMPEKGPVMSSPLPEITVADLRAPELPRQTQQPVPTPTPVTTAAVKPSAAATPSPTTTTATAAAANYGPHLYCLIVPSVFL